MKLNGCQIYLVRKSYNTSLEVYADLEELCSKGLSQPPRMPYIAAQKCVQWEQPIHPRHGLRRLLASHTQESPTKLL